MRPLFHPAIEDVRPEAILYALSDPERVAIYAQIAGIGSGGTCTAFSNLGARVIPKSSLSQHIKVLREAGLIRCERHGVEMRNHSRCMEVDDRFPGLLAAILSAYGPPPGEAKAG
ncbi:ArsR family transcriptional regulator [Neorhizobium sp. P12A]|jgi:DNA-binding transcriptional ArsR family regulator|uniref:ArsR/SmtB family transcription factor n=1 Tax=Rhizobium/Agrobacterium group TaxID=227290 RepID=UPI0010453BEB|nr:MULTISPECIES: helix-turn-helix domain-containing protein [Rhizobium/Agrobacterium group]KAA0694381.1 ArsR family transcriptional regulator [Neorhizobium sp. P12A]TCR85487.1 ArsR family transcriptional regulator [Rhizobium sp. BK376]